MKGLTLGSRKSPLAMAQSWFVQRALSHAHNLPVGSFGIAGFTTTGDRILDRSLQDAGGKGLFTKELDDALLEGRIDAAVHSMKDLPTKLPKGLALVCVPAREDPRDVLISRRAVTLADLPSGATIGSASLRRQAQALNMRPDLRVQVLRGSVATRIQRVMDGDVDATFLAAAGLNRLGLQEHAAVIISTDSMLPAVGQGAIAIVCRGDDMRTRDLLAPLDVADARIATAAERAFLEVLDGSCRTPIAGHASIKDRQLRLDGEVLTPDGRNRWRGHESVFLMGDPLGAAVALGRKLGLHLRAQAGSMHASIVDSRPDNWIKSTASR